MDCMPNLVVFFLGLLLANADFISQGQPEANISATAVTSNNSIAPTPRTCPKATAPTPRRKVFLVTVSWDNDNSCNGAVHLSLPKGGPKPVCFDSTYIDMFKDLCQPRCEKFHAWEESVEMRGQYLNDSGRVTNTNCKVLRIQCKALQTNKSQGKSTEGELVAYKAVTGLLILLVLAVLLFFFGRPTYTAIRKRLSQKRQSRWIGPTQTQSVYYNRDQPPGPNNNTFKRHSYPALENLTVAASREPSSNRNSDYSYN